MMAAEMLPYGCHRSGSERETFALAVALAETLRPGDFVAFFGGMGMGKTAFTRGLAEGLGIDAGEVSSPTFALMNEYRGAGRILYHFDMYRVTDEDSLFSTGFFDYLDGGGIVAVEWSENIRAFLPESFISVSIAPGGEETSRTIEIKRIKREAEQEVSP